MELSRAKYTPLFAEDDPVYNDDDYTAWTGWTLDQLKSMTSLVAPRMCYSKYRSPLEAVCLFWTKLKTNLSFRQIGALFKIDTQENSIGRRVEDTFHGVWPCLNETLTSEYLEMTHLRRTQALDHHTAYPRAFFGDHLSVIWDGTYIYCNRSNDHRLQRLTYSGQKSRHIIKMMSLVLSDGYILEFIGPFYGKDNDASISKVIGQDRWFSGQFTIFALRAISYMMELHMCSGTLNCEIFRVEEKHVVSIVDLLNWEVPMQSFWARNTIQMDYLLLKNIQNGHIGNIFYPIIFDFSSLKGNLCNWNVLKLILGNEMRFEKTFKITWIHLWSGQNRFQSGKKSPILINF